MRDDDAPQTKDRQEITASKPSDTERRPHDRRLLVLAVAGSLLLIAIGMFLFTRSNQPKPTPQPPAQTKKTVKQPIKPTAPSAYDTLAFDQEGDMQPPPGANQNAPYFHKVLRADSADGLNFSKDPAFVIDKASVPDVVVGKDGTIFLYAVDGANRSKSGVLVSVSKDKGATWKTGSLKVSDGSYLGVDPQAVLLDNGQIRVYYLHSSMFAPGSHGDGQDNKILSATSSDGIAFVKDEGVRLEKPFALDPDVVKIGGTWFMYLNENMRNSYATSSDGLAFSYAGPVQSRGAVSKTVALDDGQFRQYFCRDRMYSALSRDGINWAMEPGNPVTGEGGQIVCDPTAAKIDGKWLLFYKTVGR